MIDTREKGLYKTATDTLQKLEEANKQGCLEFVSLQLMAKAINHLKIEHAFAAVALYKTLILDDIGSAILSSKTQAGKTGAIIAFCVLLYEQARVGNFTEQYKLWFTGPSDLILRDQTEERLFGHDSIAVHTLGSKCWHHGEFYRNGTEKQKLMQQWQSHMNLGYTMFVFADEAHIGIGTTNACTQYQKLPELFSTLGGIPGLKTQSNVKYILISATPYTFDLMMATTPNADMREVWLCSGTNYSGLPDHLTSGRIKLHIKRDRDQTDAQYAGDIQELMEDLDSANYHNPGYFPFRVTVNKDRKLFEEAAAKAGVKYKVFLSSEGNISEFQSILEQQPDENMILIIVRSYKQGKTLCKEYIRAWYEADTKSKNGRNDADVYQSVGRNDGYDIGHLDYPIFMCLDQADRIVEYIVARESGVGTIPAMSSTHTKTKDTIKKITGRATSTSKLNTIHEYNRITGEQRTFKDFGTLNLSRINETGRDLIDEFLSDTFRNVRKGKKLNLYNFDSPRPNSQNSWDNNPQLQGKWGVIWPTSQTIEIKEVARDSSQYSKK